MNFIKKKLKSHKKDDEEEEYEKAVYEQSLHPQGDQKMKNTEEWQFFQQLSMKVQDTVQKTQTTLNKLKDIRQDSISNPDDKDLYDMDDDLLSKDNSTGEVPPYGTTRVLRAPPRPPPPAAEKPNFSSDADFGTDFTQGSPAKGPPRPPPPGFEKSSDLPFNLDSSALHGTPSKSFGSPARPPPPSTGRQEYTHVVQPFPVSTDLTVLDPNPTEQASASFSLLDEFGFQSGVSTTSNAQTNFQDLLFLDDKEETDPFDTSFVDVSNISSKSSLPDEINGTRNKLPENSFNPFSSTAISDDWMTASSNYSGTSTKAATNPFFSGMLNEIKSDEKEEKNQSWSSHNPFGDSEQIPDSSTQNDDFFGISILSSSSKDIIGDTFQKNEQSLMASLGQNSNDDLLKSAFTMDQPLKVEHVTDNIVPSAQENHLEMNTKDLSGDINSLNDIWNSDKKVDNDIFGDGIMSKGDLPMDTEVLSEPSLVWNSNVTNSEILLPEKFDILDEPDQAVPNTERIFPEYDNAGFFDNTEVLPIDQANNFENTSDFFANQTKLDEQNAEAVSFDDAKDSDFSFNKGNYNMEFMSNSPESSDKKGSIVEDQSNRIPEDRKSSIPEDRKSSIPEDRKSSIPEDRKGSIPEDRKSSIPEDRKSSIPEDRKCSIPEDRKSSISEDYENNIPEDQISSIQENRKSSMPEDQNSYIPEEIKSIMPQDRKSSIPHDRKSSIPQDRKSSIPQDRKSSIPQDRKSSIPQDRKGSIPQDRKTSIPQDRKTSIPQDRKVSIPEDQQSSIPQDQEINILQPSIDISKKFDFKPTENKEIELNAYETSVSHFNADSFSKPFEEENETNAFVFKVKTMDEQPDLEFDAFAAKFESAKDNHGSDAFDPFMSKRAPTLKKIKNESLGFGSMDEFDPFKVTRGPEENFVLKKEISRDSFEDYDNEMDFSVVIKPKVKDASDVKPMTMEPPKLLPPPKTPTKAFETTAPRFNPFDKDFVDPTIQATKPPEKHFEPLEVEEDHPVPALGEAGVRKADSIDTPLSPLFDEDTSLPLEVFPQPYGKEVWEMVLRQPNKKKLTGNRFWKKIFVKLSENSVLQLFNKEDDKLPFQELPLQACYSLSEIGAQQYDQYGKIFTVKLQYKFYRERVGVRPGQISKVTQGQVTSMGDVAKLGLPLQHSAQTSQLLKIGSQSYKDIKLFIQEIEDALFRMVVHRDRVLTYKTEEVQVIAQDEFYVEQSKTGHIDKQLARVRIFFLAFITGMPSVEVGLNDINRQGKEVVGRYDIMPVVTEEWIRLEDCEFHSSVIQDEFQKNRVIKFHPPDACLFELLRFRIRPPKNRELPLQVRVFMTVSSTRVEIRSDILVPGYSSRKQGQIPCENIQIRFPVPECWIYLFRTEKHFRYGSKKSTARRPGKIKGLERIIGAAQNLDPSLIEVSAGQAKYEHVFHAVVWRIPRLPKEGQGAYTQQLFLLRTELTSFDQIPESFEQYVDVEFTMPATYVSHTTVRSVSVTNPIPPEKYVRYISKHEYKVEIEFKSSSDDIDGLMASPNVNVPVSTTPAVQESTEDEEKDDDSD